ncbi:MAG: hypothetical protein WDO56_23415 [Gammaproteobacteria bacterium]
MPHQRHLEPEGEHDRDLDEAIDACRKAELRGRQHECQREQEELARASDEQRDDFDRGGNFAPGVSPLAPPSGDVPFDQRQHGERDAEQKDCEHPLARGVPQKFGLPEIAKGRHCCRQAGNGPRL